VRIVLNVLPVDERTTLVIFTYTKDDCSKARLHHRADVTVRSGEALQVGDRFNVPNDDVAHIVVHQNGMPVVPTQLQILGLTFSTPLKSIRCKQCAKGAPRRLGPLRASGKVGGDVRSRASARCARYTPGCLLAACTTAGTCRPSCMLYRRDFSKGRAMPLRQR
jgi:hypothetical protein